MWFLNALRIPLVRLLARSRGAARWASPPVATALFIHGCAVSTTSAAAAVAAAVAAATTATSRPDSRAREGNRLVTSVDTEVHKRVGILVGTRELDSRRGAAISSVHNFDLGA